MSQVLNIILVGGILVVGFVMVQSYQATGNPFSFIPTPVQSQIKTVSDDDDDKGEKVSTKKIATTVVEKKQSTSKPISPIGGSGTPKAVVTGSKKTSKGDPTSTGITGTSCSLKYRTMCHVRYYSNGKPFCYCPALSGKAGFRESQSRHVSIYSHSHDRLNIPRAFIGKKRKSANDVRINAF